MKLLFAIAVVSGSLFASQTEPSREDLLNTVRHIQRLAKEQEVELNTARVDLGTAQSNLVTLQTNINKLAQHDANETAAKKHILHKYHILKAIACAIAAAVAVFVVMQLTSFVPVFLAPYKIYLYAGAGVAAATAVAVFL
jgi:Flp pilus assembly protein TadB